jgi:hypothetical protein
MATERRIFALICFIAAIAFTILFIQIHNNQGAIESQVKRNRETIESLEAAKRVLCARGTIINDLIRGGILLIEQRLGNDLAVGNLEAVKADREFLNIFADNFVKMTNQLTEKGSPCATSQ